MSPLGPLIVGVFAEPVGIASPSPSRFAYFARPGAAFYHPKRVRVPRRRRVVRIGRSALHGDRFDADADGMSTGQETVCEVCDRPDEGTSDAKPTVVVIMTSQGQEFVRHRRCHMQELLDRA